MRLIHHFPESRQTFEYDCSAKSLHSILSFYGIDTNEINIIKLAKTNSLSGTSLKGIKIVANHFNLNFKIKKMTVEELKENIDKNHPVIILLQAWPEKKTKNWETEYNSAHYVTAIGYDSKKIYFEDPYTIERTYLNFKELEKRWHARDPDTKKKLQNIGIILTKKGKHFLNNPIHMN